MTPPSSIPASPPRERTPSRPPPPPSARGDAGPRAPPRRLRLALAVLVAALATLAACPATWAHLRAASLLARASGGTSGLATLYDTPIVVENALLRTRYGTFRARVYRPRDGAPRRGLLLAHGVHFMGIDEPRLIPFARNLARAGLVVMTPELAALADYTVAPSSVEELRVATRHLATRPYVRPGGVALLGLSFAGGLALIAAADPAVRPHVAGVTTLGGHHDLYRVSRFLATDELETPAGVRRMRAHDYGLIVFFYAHAEHFVAREQLFVFRDALRAILHLDRPGGERAAAHLTGEARALYEQIARNDKRALAPLVLRAMPALRAEMRALSPAGRLDALADVPVTILHGAADDVIPPTEAEDNARELAARGRGAHLLLSRVIHHVTVEGTPTLREQWELVHAMAGVVD